MEMRASIKFEKVGKMFTGSTKVDGVLFLSKGTDKDKVKKEIKQAVKEFVN